MMAAGGKQVEEAAQDGAAPSAFPPAAPIKATDNTAPEVPSPTSPLRGEVDARRRVREADATTLAAPPPGQNASNPVVLSLSEDEQRFSLRPEALSFAGELKCARRARNIDDSVAAAMFGLSVMEYFDLEAYPDEWWNVLPASIIANVAYFFEIDWRACGTWVEGERPNFLRNESLNSYCRRLRVQCGLTPDGFADKVGFSEVFTHLVEGHPHGMSLYPLVVTQYLAGAFALHGLPIAEAVMKRPR